MRKRHKGSEEEHGVLAGTGKARGRSQPWDEHGASSDSLSQVSALSRALARLPHDVFAGLVASHPPEGHMEAPSC